MEPELIQIATDGWTTMLSYGFGTIISLIFLWVMSTKMEHDPSEIKFVAWLFWGILTAVMVFNMFGDLPTAIAHINNPGAFVGT